MVGPIVDYLEDGITGEKIIIYVGCMSRLTEKVTADALRGTI